LQDRSGRPPIFKRKLVPKVDVVRIIHGKQAVGLAAVNSITRKR